MRRSALLAAMLLLVPALARGGEQEKAPVWPDGVRATRMKLVHALGLGAPDTGYAVFECPNCGRDLVAPATFPGAEGPDSVLDMRLAVERFFLAGHETGRIRPAPECPHCRGPVPGKKLPRAILFGHVSSEAGGDLHPPAAPGAVVRRPPETPDRLHDPPLRPFRTRAGGQVHPEPGVPAERPPLCPPPQPTGLPAASLVPAMWGHSKSVIHVLSFWPPPGTSAPT